MRVQLVASPHVLCAPSHQELCCNRRVGTPRAAASSSGVLGLSARSVKISSCMAATTATAGKYGLMCCNTSVHSAPDVVFMNAPRPARGLTSAVSSRGERMRASGLLDCDVRQQPETDGHTCSSLWLWGALAPLSGPRP